MEISRATVAVVAAACVTAGAAGGYVLTRTAAPAAAQAPSTDLSPAPLEVEHSDQIVAEPPSARPVVRPASKPRVSAAPATPPPVAPPPAPAAVEHSVTPPEPPQSGTEVVAIAPAAIENTRSSEVLIPHPLEPPPPELEELVIADDSVIGLQIESAVSSETAHVEDRVVARVSRDVRVGNKVAIPAGARAQGEVTLVERGGKVKERARLGVRFTSIVLGDGTTLPIATETIYREGESPARESTTKIGVGAIAGTIIGGIIGGGKGAAIGGAVGGGAGSATVLAGGRNPATLSPGSPVTIRLREQATVTVEK